MDHKFKPWLRQVIKVLHRDGVLSNTDLTGIIVSNYEDVEELFEHGLGSQLAAQLLIEDLYECENEDGGIELIGDIPDVNGDGDDEDLECDDDDPDDDDPDDENIDNMTSEDSDDDGDYSDCCRYRIIEIFDTRFASAKLLKSERNVFLIRILRTIYLI